MITIKLLIFPTLCFGINDIIPGVKVYAYLAEDSKVYFIN